MTAPAPARKRSIRRTLTEDRILDIILSPAGRWTIQRIAQTVGVTPQRVSLIIRSDSFQAKLQAARSARLAMLNGRLLELAEGSSEQLLEALRKRETTIEEALEIAKFATETLGYSPKSPSQQANVLVNVDASLLMEAKKALRSEVVDITPEGEPSQ